MKFPAPYIRKQLVALLSGNVTYNSVNIPTYEGEAPLSQAPFIIIGTYSHQRQANKHSFIYEAQQLIEIVTIKDDPTAKTADAVTELVMNLIHPDTDSMLMDTADFGIQVVSETVGVLREDSVSGKKVFRRFIQYNFLIDQK
jgi:hypothetical protein